MPHRERAATGRLPSEHIVQLFDDPESRGAGVATYIQEGLAAGEPVISIAKASHWSAIFRNLERRGVSVTFAMSSGALHVFDATQSVAAVMYQDRPIRSLFRAAVGTTVARLAARHDRPVRVYGEMVEVLAQSGNFLAVAELEALWNELAAEHRLLLLCGYSSGHFGPEHTASALREICRAHSKVQTLATDPLGAWLTAHVTPGSTTPTV